MRASRAAAMTIVVALLSCSSTMGQTSSGHPSVAQALELARVWLEAQRAYEQIPGVSAAIVHDQKILWAGGYGFADIAAGKPAQDAGHLRISIHAGGESARSEREQGIFYFFEEGTEELSD